MKIHHIAFWTENMEQLCSFYQTYCQGVVLFKHKSGNFQCTFLEIMGSVTLEIMTMPGIAKDTHRERIGYSHFSIEVESRDEVDKLTDYCIREGIVLTKKKEQYEDGFYESAFADPDGNIIEIAYIDRKVNPHV